jgi:hypothetical protein
MALGLYCSIFQLSLEVRLAVSVFMEFTRPPAGASTMDCPSPKEALKVPPVVVAPLWLFPYAGCFGFSWFARLSRVAL